jgi:hypothetical protein
VRERVEIFNISKYFKLFYRVIERQPSSSYLQRGESERVEIFNPSSLLTKREIGSIFT